MLVEALIMGAGYKAATVPPSSQNTVPKHKGRPNGAAFALKSAMSGQITGLHGAGTSR